MTISIPYELDSSTCAYRLPCGLCRMTMTNCPKNMYSVGVGIACSTSYGETPVVKEVEENDGK